MGDILLALTVQFLIWCLLGWLLMLIVGAVGLGWGFWPCFGIVAVASMIISLATGD